MARPRSYDTNGMTQGQNISHDMPTDRPIERSEFADQFEIIETATPKSLDAEAFYEEMVEVEILPTERPDAEQIIPLICNGVNQSLIRGVPVFVRRKFVEILARCKTEIINTPEYTDFNGNRATKITKAQGLRYPFRVVTDKNPNGREWLESVMRQGA